MVSNACMLKEINIQTVTKEDIPFSSPFTVTMKRNDYVQVRTVCMAASIAIDFWKLLARHDCSFSVSHK